MLFQAEKRTILVILAWGRPKMASGRVKRLRNAFGRPKMTLETEKHLENDLFGLKKHPKNTPVLKGDFGSFLWILRIKRGKTARFSLPFYEESRSKVGEIVRLFWIFRISPLRGLLRGEIT